MISPTIATEPCCKQCTRDNRIRYADRARFHADEAAAMYRKTVWLLGVVVVLVAASLAIQYLG